MRRRRFLKCTAVAAALPVLNPAGFGDEDQDTFVLEVEGLV